jgi:uncharacterized membrane-anchored protein
MSQASTIRPWILLFAAACCPAVLAGAEATPQQQAVQSAGEAARAALVRGPANVALSDEATLALPEHFGFVPRQQATALMSAMGNRTSPGFLGLIVPLGSQQGWFVSLVYDAAGYIKDDDATHWEAGKLLQSLKDGTEAANAERAKAGVPALEVTRWVEPPAYSADTHRLIWSAEARRKDHTDADPTINYNTYLLGRGGYLSLNLVTSASAIEADKGAARELLAAVSFNSGKRYADFNSSTDKVAAYGLAALVAGVAAKKLGLLALLIAGAVKFAKVIALAALGVFAAVMRWLKIRRTRAGP